MRASIFSCLLALFTLLNTTHGQTTVTIGTDSPNYKDAMFWDRSGLHNTNYGTYHSIIGEAWSQGGNTFRRSAFKFDFTSIPTNANISSAKLILNSSTPIFSSWASGQAGQNAFYLKRLTSDWSETGITWNNQPGHNNDTKIAGPTTPKSTYVTLEVDVKSHVQDMVANPAQNFGWLFQLQNEVRYNQVAFYSSDASDASKRPKVEITYTLTDPEPAPVVGYVQWKNSSGITVSADQAQLQVNSNANTSLVSNTLYSNDSELDLRWTVGANSPTVQIGLVNHTATTGNIVRGFKVENGNLYVLTPGKSTLFSGVSEHDVIKLSKTETQYRIDINADKTTTLDALGSGLYQAKVQVTQPELTIHNVIEKTPTHHFATTRTDAFNNTLNQVDISYGNTTKTVSATSGENAFVTAQDITNFNLAYENTGTTWSINVALEDKARIRFTNGSKTIRLDHGKFSLITKSIGEHTLHFFDFLGSGKDIVKLVNDLSVCNQENQPAKSSVQTLLYDGDGNLYGETKAYLDGLGRAQQLFSRNRTEGTEILKTYAFDQFGRPNVSTLPAVTYANDMCYKEYFFTNNSGEAYSHSDFDYQQTQADGTSFYSNSNPIGGQSTKGSLGWYYSNQNNEEQYAPTSNYPFTVTEFMEDPRGVVKKQGGLGEHHKINSGHEVKSFILPHHGELAYIYGTDHYMEGVDQPIAAWKQVQIDEEGKESITFYSSENQVIATCVSGQNKCLDQIVRTSLSTLNPKTFDIHVHFNNKNDLKYIYTPPAFSYVYQTVVSPTILDIETNKRLVEGTDYNLNASTGVITFLNDYNDNNWSNGSKFFRIGLGDIDTSYLEEARSYFVNGDLPSGYKVGDQAFEYQLDYSHWNINYFDKLGQVTKEVPPAGIDCDVYNPNEIFVQDIYIGYESLHKRINETDIYKQQTYFTKHVDLPSFTTTTTTGINKKREFRYTIKPTAPLTPSGYTFLNPDKSISGNICEILIEFNTQSVGLSKSPESPEAIEVINSFPLDPVMLKTSNGTNNSLRMYTPNHTNYTNLAVQQVLTQEKAKRTALKGHDPFGDIASEHVTPDGCELCPDYQMVTVTRFDGTTYEVKKGTCFSLKNNFLSKKQAIARGEGYCNSNKMKLLKVTRGLYNQKQESWCIECGNKLCDEDEPIEEKLASFKVEVDVLVDNQLTNSHVVSIDLMSSTDCTGYCQVYFKYWDAIQASGLLSSDVASSGLTNTSQKIDFRIGNFYIKRPGSNQFLAFNDVNLIDRFYKLMGLRVDAVYEEKAIQSLSQAPQSMANTYQYDQHNQLRASHVLDKGQTEMLYDIRGRVVASRTAEQKAQNKFSYQLFDEYHRLSETGVYTENTLSIIGGGSITYVFPELDGSAGIDETSIQTIINSLDNLPDNLRSERTYYYYDTPHSIHPGMWTVYRSIRATNKLAQTENDNTTTWYSYNEDGALTYMAVLDKLNNNTLSYFTYYYDTMGKLTRINYLNTHNSTYVFHNFLYNADEKLREITAYVKSHGVIKESRTIARYFYSQLGHLERTELADGLQNIDYVYTIQGWLKSINHPNLGNHDPSKGLTNKDGYAVPEDVFGLSLDYYNGDYVKNGTGMQSYGNQSADAIGIQDRFDGNIKSVRWQTNSSSHTAAGNFQYNNQHLFYGFNYDALNRLTLGQFGVVNNEGNENNGGNQELSVTKKDDYKLWNITYDRNGNIQSLNRNGHGSSASNRQMDAFTYRYKTGSNRLARVDDAVSASNWTTDLDNQTAAGAFDVNTLTTWNYQYDKEGKLIGDKQEQNFIDYTATGLVKTVYSDAAKTNKKVAFFYNERGQRIRKVSYNNNVKSKVTRYIIDPMGMTHSIETTEFNANGDVTASDTEFPVGGQAHVGRYNRANDRFTYELSDHLGNIRAVIEDRRHLTTTLVNNSFNSSSVPAAFQTYGNASTSMVNNTTMRVSATGNAAGLTANLNTPDVGKRYNIRLTYTTGLTPTELANVKVKIRNTNTNTYYPETWPLQTDGNMLVSFVAQSVHDRVYLVNENTGTATVDFTQFGIEEQQLFAMTSISDFYPYGAIMPGRNSALHANTPSYQGQLKDAETNWSAFKLRMYDGRLARWHSADPFAQHWSPYTAMGNNPISRIDPDGGTDYYIDGLKVSSGSFNMFAKWQLDNIDRINFTGIDQEQAEALLQLSYISENLDELLKQKYQEKNYKANEEGRLTKEVNDFMVKTRKDGTYDVGMSSRTEYVTLRDKRDVLDEMLDELNITDENSSNNENSYSNRKRAISALILAATGPNLPKPRVFKSNIPYTSAMSRLALKVKIKSPVRIYKYVWDPVKSKFVQKSTTNLIRGVSSYMPLVGWAISGSQVYSEVKQKKYDEAAKTSIVQIGAYFGGPIGWGLAGGILLSDLICPTGDCHEDLISDPVRQKRYHGTSVCFIGSTLVSSKSGLVEIKDLEIGDFVYSFNKKTSKVELNQILTKHKHFVRSIFELKVSANETILVTGDHPFYVKDKNAWIKVRNLKKGDQFLSQENELIEVLSIDEKKYEGFVYNIEVDNLHNYFISGKKILVHNK